MYTIDPIRSALYNVVIPNTPHFYNFFLKQLTNNSRILEVGIGNGCCLPMNAHIIKRKQLHIDGIDIDVCYLKDCNNVIKDCELEDYVIAKYQDLLKMKTNVKYDIILFSESYPVIPIDIMKKMMDKCKKLLKATGTVCFIHNLEENKELIREFIKPNLKYVTSVDFGRLTTHREFDEFVEDVEYKLVRKELIEKVYLSKLCSIPLLRPIDKFFVCNQYCIWVRPN